MKTQQTHTKLKILLSTLVLILTVFLISCKSDTDKTQTKTNQISSDSIPSVVAKNDSLDAIVKSIIEISSNDFFKNQKPLPIAFRNVQIRYNIKSDKEILYILCGEFAPQSKSENAAWTHFTTIKNSDYEQWIGPNGITYCENSKEIPYSKMDLSTELKNKLNTLQKTEK